MTDIRANEHKNFTPLDPKLLSSVHSSHKAVVFGLLVLLAIVVVGSILALSFSGKFLSSPTPTPTPQAGRLPTSPIEPSPTKLVATASPTIAATQEPQVTFENEQLIPTEDRALLTERVVGPMTMYYRDTSTTDDNLTSIIISQNNSDTRETYPYLVSATHVSGANSQLAIEKKDGALSWWFPECLGECQYSDAFKQKYPEIVAATSAN